MMEWNRRFIVITCLFAALVVIGTTTYAAPVVISTPLEISDVGTLLLPLPMVVTEAKGLEASPLDTQYDMTINVNDTWHYARLVVYRDAKDIGITADIFNQVSTNPQMLQLISGTVKGMIAQSINNNGAQLLQWYPRKPATVGKHNAVNVTSRLIMTEKLPITMFAND